MSSANLLDVLSNGSGKPRLKSCLSSTRREPKNSLMLCARNNPARVVPQFPKFFNAIEKCPSRAVSAFPRDESFSNRYDLEYPDGPGTRPVATGMHACIGKDRKPCMKRELPSSLRSREEFVPFPEPLPLNGKVSCHCTAQLRRRGVMVSFTGRSVLGALHRGSGPS